MSTNVDILILDGTIGYAGLIFGPFLPNTLDETTVTNALDQIREILCMNAQNKSWGSIFTHGMHGPQGEMSPKIVFGFPDATGLRGLERASRVLPVVVLQDYSEQLAMSSWLGEPVDKEIVNLTNISLGMKNDLVKAGSFGGWWITASGEILGLTCNHVLPGAVPGDIIVSPSSLELTAQLNVALPYTDLGVECIVKRPPKITFCQELLREYDQANNIDGPCLKDGRRIALAGRTLGWFKTGEFGKFPILQEHNQRLPEDRRFILPLGEQIESKIDWAIFSAVKERVGQNYMESSCAMVTQIADAMPGDKVIKIGRTTSQTTGKVNGVGVIEWDSGNLAQEIVVVPYPNLQDRFADKGDSGSLLVRLGDEGDDKVVGILHAKSGVWTAITPIWAVMERAHLKMGESLTLAQ